MVAQIENDARYAGYVERQRAAIATMRREESRALPADIDYSALPGLSAELRQKLTRIRPESLAQAGRIDGMTPAALAIILSATRRRDQRRPA
jgi:tRNA uridine 5-carboxymethylaminomethyl modification enzyme